MFFASWPDALARRQLEGISEGLRLVAPARRVPAANFHLTVAFVGEVSNSRVADLRRIGGSQQAARFSLRLDAIDFWAKAQIVVAAAEEVPAPLQSLCSRLHEELGIHALPMRPHVTLARKVAQAPVPQALSPIEWSMSSFSLVVSETRATHAAYTVLDTWQLLYET